MTTATPTGPIIFCTMTRATPDLEGKVTVKKLASKKKKVEKATEAEEEEVPAIIPRVTTKKWTRAVLRFRHIPKFFEPQDLKKWCDQFATVTRATIWHDKDTGKAVGMGFVEFRDADAAKVLADKMNGVIIQNRSVEITLCDMDREKANKLFRRTKYEPPLTREERTNKIIEEGRSAANSGAAGRKLLEEAGIKCDWTPLSSIEEALAE